MGKVWKFCADFADHDGHHGSPVGAGDGFAVAGSVGVSHSGDSSSRSNDRLLLGADAIPVVTDERSIGEQRSLRSSSYLHLLGQSADDSVQVDTLDAEFSSAAAPLMPCHEMVGHCKRRFWS